MGKTNSLTYLGKTQTVQEWAKELHIPLNTVLHRMKLSSDPEKILDRSYKFKQLEILRKIYNFIVEHKENNNGLSPSIREIRDGIEIGMRLSTSRVSYFLGILSELGLIRIDSTYRGIRVPGGVWTRPQVNRLEEKLNQYLYPEKREEE